MDKAIFAAGCFWGVQAAFDDIEGVHTTLVGYTGGATENPTYREVCNNSTGHAEAVLVEYDPNIISFEKLLDVFWDIHDPTTLNRQGPDVGTQYRSTIFYYTDTQKNVALESKAQLNASGKFNRPIVTEIEPAVTFYKAEEYHQKYYVKHGIKSCRIQ